MKRGIPMGIVHAQRLRQLRHLGLHALVVRAKHHGRQRLHPPRLREVLRLGAPMGVRVILPLRPTGLRPRRGLELR